MSGRILWDGEADEELFLTAQNRLSLFATALRELSESFRSPAAGGVVTLSDKQWKILEFFEDFSEKFHVVCDIGDDLLQTIKTPLGDLYHIPPRLGRDALPNLAGSIATIFDQLILNVALFWKMFARLELAAVQYEKGLAFCDGGVIALREQPL